MRIGVVSDTHGQIEFTRSAVQMLKSLEVELVVHCGDIGSAEIVPLFSAWPTHFVFGNVDTPEGPLRAAIQSADQSCHEHFGSLELAGVRIAFLHSDDDQLFRETTQSDQYDLVCYGHTHVAKQHHEGKTLVLNPGAIYRANPHSLAIVELPSLEVYSITL